jgi:hypothetical protein
VNIRENAMRNLCISMKVPSRDLDKSPIDRAVTTLAAGIAAEQRNGSLPAAGPALDLTFLLSTKDDKPPFDGMRMGGYTPESQTLYFEAAVPEAMGHSDQAPEYVAAILQDMIDNAAMFFEEQNVTFDAQQWLLALTPVFASLTGKHSVH